ncbi:MAG: hypothetical protein ACM3QX_18170 [Syntrophomonadaceae bacterium]
MKSNTLVAIVFVACMIALIVVMATLSPRPTPENPLLPDTTYVEVPVPYVVHDTVTAANHNTVPTKHDTTIIKHTDTLYFPAGTTMFYVESDTIWQDSSWFMARYYLDPIDEFKFSYHIQEKVVQKEVEVPGIQFKSGFGLSVYAGYGYQFNAQKMGFQLGAGLTYGW